MTDTVALVLAGGKIGGFGVLTHNRTKGALPFAGHYRVIDFTLSNLSNSNITSIGVITQYLPASLIEHIGGGDAWDLHRSDCIIKIMPPFVGVGQTTWFRGTSDAVFRNLNFVHDLDPRDVIVLPGEHIYHMDYRNALEFHRSHDANLTIVGKHLPPEQLSLRFGYLKADENNAVTFFKEKPSEILGNFVSIGIYIFKKDYLIEEITKRAESGLTQNLVFDVIEPIAAMPGVYVYEFDGYWEYLENIDNYYQTSMRLLEKDSPIKPDKWEITTNLEDRALGYRPPVYIGESAHLEDSLVSPGSIIEGTVRRSILSPGVRVHQGAVIEDSILMHDCEALQGVHIKRTVSDKNVVFAKNARVGGVMKKSIQNPELPELKHGLTIIGKGAVIGEDISIDCCSQVYPGKDLTSYKGTQFAPGINIK
jgi:glucose-1-phosphate adenylyltransferase